MLVIATEMADLDIVKWIIEEVKIDPNKQS